MATVSYTTSGDMTRIVQNRGMQPVEEARCPRCLHARREHAMSEYELQVELALTRVHAAWLQGAKPHRADLYIISTWRMPVDG